MEEAQLVSVRLRNFGKHADITLTANDVRHPDNVHCRDLCNGAFDFINNCLAKNVETTIEEMGGWDEIALDQNKEMNITLEIKAEIKALLDGNKRALTITYLIGGWKKANREFCETEVLRYQRSPVSDHFTSTATPTYLIRFINGKRGIIVNNDQDLTNSTSLLLANMGQHPGFTSANIVYQIITRYWEE